jgi:putative ABC transport system permease protein
VVITNQMRYLRSADLGFDKDRQIVVPLQSQNAKNAYRAFKAGLTMQSQIASVGASTYYPGISNPSDNLFHKAGENMNAAKDVPMDYVDYNYLKTLGIQPVAGRIFSEQFPSDTNDVIILNESAINSIGFASPQKAIGQSVYFEYNNKNYARKIVGVVKDFHYEDLHLPIKPYGFQLVPDGFNYMIVHAKPGDIGAVLETVKSVWHKNNPSEPFEYSFVDADFQKNYTKEIKVSSIVGYFTAVAIVISCLGLFGLATFSAEQRIKEIGVRKVLGASVSNIVALLSMDFLKLVVVAVLIASPIAWFVMNKWLQNFAYKISISWFVFVVTTFAALFIALATISFQAIRAALTNPVKNLRTE